jgi:hypothetical protein
VDGRGQETGRKHRWLVTIDGSSKPYKGS